MIACFYIMADLIKWLDGVNDWWCIVMMFCTFELLQYMDCIKHKGDHVYKFLTEMHSCVCDSFRYS